MDFSVQKIFFTFYRTLHGSYVMKELCTCADKQNFKRCCQKKIIILRKVPRVENISAKNNNWISEENWSVASVIRLLHQIDSAAERDVNHVIM